MASLVEIAVNAVDNASKDIERVNRSIRSLEKSARMATPAIAGVSGAIAGLGPAVGAIGALGATFTSAGVGAMAFGAVATSVIGNVVDKGEQIAKLEEKIAKADTAKERLKYKKQMANVYEGMTGAQKDALKSLNQFKSWWSSFTKSLQTPVFKVMTEGLKVIQNVMTGLKPAIKSTAGVLQQFLSRINKAFDTGKAQKFMDFFNSTVAQNLSTVLKTAGNLFLGFLNILRAFSPLSTDINSGLVKMSESFRKWSAGLSKSKGFQKFINYVRTNGPKMMSILGNVISFIGKLVVALAPLGSAVLSIAGDLLQWLNNSRLVEVALSTLTTVGKFFANHLGVLKVLIAVVASYLGRFLIISAISKAIMIATNVFSKFVKVIRMARTAFMLLSLAFRANPIGFVITLIMALVAVGVYLYKNFDVVRKKANQLWSKMKDVWNSIKTAVSQAVAKVVAKVIAMKTKAVNAIKQFASNAWSAIKNGFSNIISTVVNWVADMVSKAINLKDRFVGKLGDMMSSGLDAVIDGVSNMVSGISNWVGDFLDAGKGLLDAFVDGIKSGFSNAVGAVKDGLAKVRDFLPFSPAKKGPLSDLDKSGQSFFPTWVSGALKELPKAERAISGAMRNLQTQLRANEDPVQLAFGGAVRNTVTVKVKGDVRVKGDGKGNEQTARFDTTEVVTDKVQDGILSNFRQSMRSR